MGSFLRNLLPRNLNPLEKQKNLLNGYVMTAIKINAQTKHCSAKCEKQVKVSNGQWLWAGCIMEDVCMKFH